MPPAYIDRVTPHRSACLHPKPSYVHLVTPPNTNHCLSRGSPHNNGLQAYLRSRFGDRGTRNMVAQQQQRHILFLGKCCVRRTKQLSRVFFCASTGYLTPLFQQSFATGLVLNWGTARSMCAGCIRFLSPFQKPYSRSKFLCITSLKARNLSTNTFPIYSLR